LSASYPQLRWSLTLFNLLKLPNGDSVVVTVHGFLGKDETVDIQNPATSERQLHFDTLAQNGVKVSNAKNLTEAIHDPQIGFQVQVLQSRTLFCCQLEGQVRSRTVHRVQLDKGGLDAPQVGFSKATANVNITCNQRGSVCDSGEPPD
jgi:hypothetical protein